MGIVSNFLGAAARFTAWRSGRKGKVRKASAGSAIHGAPAAHADAPPPMQTHEKLWAAESASNLLDKLWATADGKCASFVHSISVAVRGGPEADLRRIWFLACAAAFGRYRNRAQGFPVSSLEATWDVTGKACSITLGYVLNGSFNSVGNATGITDSGLNVVQRGPDQVTVGGSWPTFSYTFAQSTVSAGRSIVGGLIKALVSVANPFGTEVPGLVSVSNGIFAGVLQGITGAFGLSASAPIAPWTSVFYRCGSAAPIPLVLFTGSGKSTINPVRELPRQGGIFLPWRRVMPGNGGGDFGSTRSGAFRVPQLPDDGRLITTGEKRDPRVQNPKPQIDGLSRNSLVSLVSQTLQQPCLLPTPVPCSILQSAGSSGLQVYPPGNGLVGVEVDNSNLQRIVDLPTGAAGSVSTASLPAGVGPDGYPSLPATVVNFRN